MIDTQIVKTGWGKIVFEICKWLFSIYTIDDYISIGKKLQHAKGIKKLYLQLRQRKIGNARGLCIENFSNIGNNLHLPHGLNIIINDNAIIGDNCIIYQGVTVGVIHEGKNAGTPIVENNVTLCPNAVVVGGIRIGHDSIIAGNAFVNFDVPPNSIVIGNPGVIHKKK